MDFLNSGHVHFKDIDLIFSSNEQLRQKAIDNLIKEIEEQKLSYPEENEAVKHFMLQLGKGSCDNSKLGANGDIDANVIGCASCCYREFLNHVDECSNHTSYPIDYLGKLKYSPNEVEEFSRRIECIESAKIPASCNGY